MWITIDKKSDRPLMRQLYEQIKDLILDGQLASDEKLPSTRQLAADLGISRSTVLDAYNQVFGNPAPFGSDILLGYAHLTFTEITTGITRLCTALREPES